jgi:hypothetical protein
LKACFKQAEDIAAHLRGCVEKKSDTNQRFKIFTQLASDAGPLAENQVDRYRYTIHDTEAKRGSKDRFIEGPFHYISREQAGEMALEVIREREIRKIWNRKPDRDIE